MTYVLKVTGLATLWAILVLWVNGNCYLALAAVPMLISMWLATSLHSRREEA